MIGSRALVGVLAVVAMGGVLGQRPADPAEADPVRTVAVERQAGTEARRAQDALEALGRLLQAALDDGRAGTAAVMVGDQPPAQRLTTAAGGVRGAQESLVVAHEALERLRGTLAATPNPESVPTLDLTAGQLNAIAEQLEDSSVAADAFAQMRGATAEVLSMLERALIALRDDDPAEALEAATDAQAAIAEVERWEQALPTLPLWITTAAQLIDALGDVARAQLAGDDAAVADAGRAYQEAAAEARRADQALAVALAEGGSAITQPPMQQLAEALTRTRETQDAVASLVHRFAAGPELDAE